jgi:hypothetical protein
MEPSRPTEVERMWRALLSVSMVTIVGVAVATGIGIEVSTHGAFSDPDGRERFPGSIAA